MRREDFSLDPCFYKYIEKVAGIYSWRHERFKIETPLWILCRSYCSYRLLHKNTQKVLKFIWFIIILLSWSNIYNDIYTVNIIIDVGYGDVKRQKKKKRIKER